MNIWFFVGDSFDWLESHNTVSGVTRVTLELFYGAVNDREYEQSRSITPCVLARSQSELAPVSLRETLEYFATKTGKSIPPRKSSSLAPRAVQKGDYVLFTGVVWTPLYTEAFRRLAAQGIELCVLVHDIIPVERPELVSNESHRTFVEWLKVVVTTARIIFVSSRTTRDQILRWAVLVELEVPGQIVIVTFGRTELAAPLSSERLRANPKTSGVNLDSFVLCVGTIDKRKNQSFLCRVWSRLILQLGERKVPQLVLAGRNDLNSHDWDLDSTRAFVRSQITILESLSDEELTGLYRSCLFTVMPSLSEGYGLPVAESLANGKLCLASDLATIKEHAGSLVWYFDPNVETSAYDRILGVLTRPDSRLVSERRIREGYSPISWGSTFQSIAKAITEEKKNRGQTLYAGHT